MPNLKDRVIKGIQSAPSGIKSTIVERYNYAQARKLKEKQDIYDTQHDPKLEQARAEGYRKAELTYAKSEGKRKFAKNQTERQQGGSAGKLRKGVSNSLTGLSLGSANALKNDMYGVGQVDFKGMDFLTMGGPAGAGTMRNLEDLTWGEKPQPKRLNPNMGQGQSRGGIVINVGGGSGQNKKRRPTAQVPKERDWQDTIGELTGF